MLRLLACVLSLCALGLGCGGGTLGGERGPGDDPLSFADAGVPATPTPAPRTPERCGNGLDDDGDEQIDDGCACTRGETQRCFGGDPRLAGVGPCVYGTQRCVGDQEFPGWGVCGGFGQPQAERCGNQLDDDCDGTADEGCPSENPACGPQGVCVVPDRPKAKEGEPCSATNQCEVPLGCHPDGWCAPIYGIWDNGDSQDIYHPMVSAPLICSNPESKCVEKCKPTGFEPTKSGSLIGLPFTHCITDPAEQKGLFVGRSIRPEDTDLYFFVANAAKQCCHESLRVLDHAVGQQPCTLGMWLLRCE
ncbi:MAG: hypothetical protein IPG96_06375 [Proteobacteria bacterium]|nr:hypothetical protein [Pseudomonadota bacterium]